MGFPVLWGGLSTAAVYALIGLAYLLQLRATHTLNFAVGGMVGFAAVGAGTWQATHSYWIAAAMAVGCTAILALALDLLITRPIQRRADGHYAVVLALAAAFFVVVELTADLFSPNAVLGAPAVDGSVSVGSGSITMQSVVVVAVSLLATAGAATWLRWGRRGRILSAVGDDQEAAVLLCLPTRGIRSIAVVLSGVIAGVTGVLIVGLTAVTFQSGFNFALTGLIALMLGGTASAWGPLLGGLLVALVETFVARWVGASVTQYVLVAVVILLFAFRPQGILAARVRY